MKKLIISLVSLMLLLGISCYLFYEYKMPPKFLDSSLLSKTYRIEVKNGNNKATKVITDNEIIKNIISNLKFKRSKYLLFSWGTPKYIITFIQPDGTQVMAMNDCTKAEMNFSNINYIYYTKLEQNACDLLLY
ncbi:MAG: hypothetical protein WCW27_05295 [Patescibacteria group bacterium]|jgi:hypothetical protein